MARDWGRAIRVEVIELLIATPGVTALIPAGQVFPAKVPGTPSWPFVRHGSPVLTPFRLSGLDSSSMRCAIHVFAKPLYGDAGEMLATAEDYASQAAEAIAATIDGRVLPLDKVYRATLAWTGTNSLMDGDEADAWHAIVNYSAQVAG